MNVNDPAEGAEDIRLVRCNHPPGTTQADLNLLAKFEQKIRREVEEYQVMCNKEWYRWVDAGRPDLVGVSLASGSPTNPTMLRIIERARLENEY